MTDNAGKECSVVELGEMENLSPRRIQQLVKQDVIPKQKRGQYDVAGAVRGYSQYLQRQASQEVERMTLMEAKTANKILEVAQRRARLNQLKNSLIDRAQATALVHHLASTDRDSWATWPARVAASMAADLSLDAAALQASLERHVREHLSEMAEVKPEFR